MSELTPERRREIAARCRCPGCQGSPACKCCNDGEFSRQMDAFHDQGDLTPHEQQVIVRAEAALQSSAEAYRLVQEAIDQRARAEQAEQQLAASRRMVEVRERDRATMRTAMNKLLDQLLVANARADATEARVKSLEEVGDWMAEEIDRSLVNKAEWQHYDREDAADAWRVLRDAQPAPGGGEGV